MSVFQTLLDMARQSNFTIGVRAVGESKNQISLILAPAAQDGQEPALSQPVKLAGTVQEMDAMFTSELNRVIGARASLIDQVDATVAILDAATKAQAEKASAKMKSNGKGASQKVNGADDCSDDDADSIAQNGSTESATAKPSANAEAGNLFANLT